MPPEPAAEAPSLVRRLGVWDGVLVTIGSIIGTGIFLTTSDVARALPHPGLVLLAWVAGGLLTLAGALTYAELGVLFPKAGGQYHYLKEAYGPLWGFLFGWTSFFIMMTGGLATLAVGFGEYLGAFVPFFSTKHVLLALPVGSWTWTVSGGQLAGALALVGITAVNLVGLKEGAGVQNAVTVVKVASIVGLAALGLFGPSVVRPDLTAPMPAGVGFAAFGVAMIAVLWSYDGWYGFTFLAGETRDPGRSLPWGLIGGTLVVTFLYVLTNVVYLRVLPIEAIPGTTRIAEATAAALFGPWGARVVTAAVLVSTFGALSATVLFSSRVYLPMAQDGLFFRWLAAIHPRYRVPTGCLVAQGVWSVIQTFSGTYEQLYTYVVFALFLFHAATGAAVIVLRRTRPNAPRPYRTWGYPLVPLLFVATSLAFVVNTFVEKPVESGIGLAFVAAGVPAYAFWRRRTRAEPPPSVSG